MSPHVSIIIPTFRRKGSLLQLLESLSNHVDWKGTELIIAEQGDNNGVVFTAYARSHSIPLQYRFLLGRSVTHTLNEAVRLAKGTYALLLDDELTVSRNLIQSHVKNFSRTNVGATVGRIITDGQTVESGNVHTGRVDWLGRVSGGYSSSVRQEVDSAIAINMCWRKDLLKKIGGFDEKYTGNAMRFETDASMRAKKLGYKILFEPKAKVVHHRTQTGGTRKSEGRMQWYFDFFSNETYFFLKHRPKVLLPIFWLTKTEWVLRCMFGFGREVSLRSLVTPFAGFADGVRKYINYDYRS